MRNGAVYSSALLAAAVLSGCLPSIARADERLVGEKRLVGQSDSYEDCAGKLIKASAVLVAQAYGRSGSRTDENVQFLVTARPHDLTMTFDLATPKHGRTRTVSTCDDETNIVREYTVDTAVPIKPAAPMLRQIRSHVIDTLPSHDQCVMDLLSVSTTALGSVALQDGDDAEASEMRLTFTDGKVSTESRKQEHDGTWTVTSTSCMGPRETVLDLTSAAAAIPAAPRRTR